jgi:hypothetical protein
MNYSNWTLSKNSSQCWSREVHLASAEIWVAFSREGVSGRIKASAMS